jgi:Transglycosylase SLT domain
MIQIMVFLTALLATQNVLAESYYRYQNAKGGVLFTNRSQTVSGDWKMVEHHKIKSRPYSAGNVEPEGGGYNHTSASPEGTLAFWRYSERDRLNAKKATGCGKTRVSRSASGLTTISIRACAPKIIPRLPDSWPKPTYSATRENRKAQFSDMIAQAAQRHQVDEKLVHAVIQTESAYNANATSRAGAVGLMQLMPATAKRYGVTDRSDPDQNINGGTRYLRYLLNLFNYNLDLAVAAYNAGEHAVMRYGNAIPPYPETRNYVRQVLSLYNH